MKYYASKTLHLSFEETADRFAKALSEQGFGVVSRVNLSDKVKEKLGKDMPEYAIFGACNPALAWEALQVDDKIGIMLPCNFIVQQKGPDTVEVAIVDPAVALQPVDNPSLKPISDMAREKLINALESL